VSMFASILRTDVKVSERGERCARRADATPARCGCVPSIAFAFRQLLRWSSPGAAPGHFVPLHCRQRDEAGQVQPEVRSHLGAGTVGRPAFEQLRGRILGHDAWPHSPVSCSGFVVPHLMVKARHVPTGGRSGEDSYGRVDRPSVAQSAPQPSSSLSTAR
jgi:hypothetical protein